MLRRMGASEKSERQSWEIDRVKFSLDRMRDASLDGNAVHDLHARKEVGHVRKRRRGRLRSHRDRFRDDHFGRGSLDRDGFTLDKVIEDRLYRTLVCRTRLLDLDRG